MAKLSTASVRLVQKLNRKNKNNEYPIYVVVCYHGRVEKASGITCLLKDWDKKREEIKKSCPNYAILNKRLHDIKEAIIERRNHYHYTNRHYTPSMLLEDGLEDGIDVNVKSNSYKLLSQSLVEERRLRLGTRVRYRYAYTKLCIFFRKDDFLVDELTVSKLKDFSAWLSKEGLSDGSIRSILGVIASVYNYAIANSVVDSKSNPFIIFKYRKKYHEPHRDYYLTSSQMLALKEYFMDMVIIRKGKSWTYKDGAYERLHKRNSKEFALLWFLLCIKYNGSAPADVALLKRSDVSRIDIEGVEYYRLQFKRIKTGSSVNCIIKRDIFTIICLEHFLGEGEGKYIYPIICSDTEDEGTIKKCIHRLSAKVRDKVRLICAEINEKIIDSNVMNDTKEPLIDVEKVVLYTGRHSRANEYLQQSNASVSGLCTMLSRSPNTISTYIHQLQGNKEVADINNYSVI